MNKQLSASVIVSGHLSLSRLQGADTKLFYLSAEHMSGLRDRERMNKAMLFNIYSVTHCI